MFKTNLFSSTLFAFLLTSCTSTRIPVKIGDVPPPAELSIQDEEYGQQVLDQITDSTPLDRDDGNVNRVRDIVDRITAAANADQQPWHVYVLKDDSVKNAAATRGNYVFVWTGILSSVRSDGELACILAHEIGHVLAKHTAPNPAEEANQMITGTVGDIADSVIGSASGYGIAGSLANMIITSSLNAFLVNPNAQRLEYEADQIGIFLMADAGYDPEDAVRFWTRAKDDPDFGKSTLQFLSTHPSSDDRLIRLQKMLPESLRRYQNAVPMRKRKTKSYIIPSGSVTGFEKKQEDSQPPRFREYDEKDREYSNRRSRRN